MTLGGGDKKKVIALGVLFAVLGVVFYFNVLAGPSTPSGASQRTPVSPRAAAVPAYAPAPDEESPAAAPRKRASSSSREFVPILRSKRPEERLDPGKIDPTLRLDLLAKVQEVGPAGGTRNLFQIGPAPPKQEEKPKGPEPVLFVKYGPNPPPPPAPPPAPPPPPPIPYKYYGIATVRNNGKKTAYFLDGEEILYGTEGETLKRRYKVLEIAPTSVLMEDTESKNKQRLPLVEESQS
jgi:hypothetical protein